MSGAKIACYILTSPCGDYYWAGPGFRPLARLARRVPSWDTLAEAAAAARALGDALGLVAVPCLMRLRPRDRT
jgi:hypothetical protein